MDSAEKFKMIIGKNDKILNVKDPEGNDVELILAYPKMRDSQYFWDSLMVITETFDKINKNKIVTVEDVANNTAGEVSELVSMASKVVPKLTEYICNNIEKAKSITLTTDDYDYYYVVVLTNLNLIITEFTQMFSKMFPAQKKAGAP